VLRKIRIFLIMIELTLEEYFKLDITFIDSLEECLKKRGIEVTDLTPINGTYTYRITEMGNEVNIIRKDIFDSYRYEADSIRKKLLLFYTSNDAQLRWNNEDYKKVDSIIEKIKGK
jgi:hypothetical protein